ncbi:hypothetical protein BGX24_006648 [Mortierella sp. AD032]|nr:hypothetical protein BGX24_006648 [Mortierella sp. AD032]
MSRFIFEQADRTALRRYARECLVSDLLIGLTYPFGPFVQLCFSSNLRMFEAAERRVERHAEQCAKAFAYSYLTPSITATPSASATAVAEASYPLTRNVIRNLSATLTRRIIRASEGPSIPLAVPSQTAQATTLSTAAAAGIVSPASPVPGLQATANIPDSTPIQIPGQQEQQQQPDFVEWFTA